MRVVSRRLLHTAQHAAEEIEWVVTQYVQLVVLVGHGVVTRALDVGVRACKGVVGRCERYPLGDGPII